MVVLACPCLNVKLRAKEIEDWSAALGPELNPGVDSKGFEDIMRTYSTLALNKITLDLGGLSAEEPSLSREEVFGVWRVVSCDNCSCVCYMSAERQPLLASTKLIQGAETISGIRARDDYSSVFGMVLFDNCSEENFDDLFVKNDHLGRVNCKEVRERLQRKETECLRKEREDMEKRVEAFKQEEQKKLKALEGRIAREKLNLYNSIFKSASMKVSGEIATDAVTRSEAIERPPAPKKSIRIQIPGDAAAGEDNSHGRRVTAPGKELGESVANQVGKVADKYADFNNEAYYKEEQELKGRVAAENGNEDGGVSTSRVNFRFESESSTNSAPLVGSLPAVVRTGTGDSDVPLFSLDLQDELESGQGESEGVIRKYGESEDEDDEDFTVETPRAEDGSMSIYSSSVPVCIPNSRMRYRSEEDDGSFDVETDKVDIDTIAASMREMSMLTDDKLFGEKPPKRKLTIL
eukprot:Nk52_evm1s128 gene=Nk52_evmTU1s128